MKKVFLTLVLLLVVLTMSSQVSIEVGTGINPIADKTSATYSLGGVFEFSGFEAGITLGNTVDTSSLFSTANVSISKVIYSPNKIGALSIGGELMTDWPNKNYNLSDVDIDYGFIGSARMRLSKGITFILEGKLPQKANGEGFNWQLEAYGKLRIAI